MDSGSASENVNVNWTVSCADSTGTQNQLGATGNAATPLTVPLAPLPPTAADGTCQVNVGITLSTHDVTPKMDFTGTLSYTPRRSLRGAGAAGVNRCLFFRVLHWGA